MHDLWILAVLGCLSYVRDSEQAVLLVFYFNPHSAFTFGVTGCVLCAVCCVLCIWWRHLFQCRSSFMPPLPSMVLSAKEGNIGGCYHQWWPAKSSVSWAEWAWWLCICSNSFPWPRITQTKNDGLSFCYVLAGVFFLFFFLSVLCLYYLRSRI